jgi:hypothetical protein
MDAPVPSVFLSYRRTLLLDSRVLCSTMVREAHLLIEGY